MRSPRERIVICSIDCIRFAVRLVSWLSSSREIVSTFWPTLRTSCATTPKPAPSAPARELSISAFSASIFIWLVICWIDLAFSQAIWSTSAVSRAIRVEISNSSSPAAGSVGAAIALPVRLIAATIGLFPQAGSAVRWFASDAPVSA